MPTSAKKSFQDNLEHVETEKKSYQKQTFKYIPSSNKSLEERIVSCLFKAESNKFIAYKGNLRPILKEGITGMELARQFVREIERYLGIEFSYNLHWQSKFLGLDKGKFRPE